jgi:hypothetical protein
METDHERLLEAQSNFLARKHDTTNPLTSPTSLSLTHRNISIKKHDDRLL